MAITKDDLIGVVLIGTILLIVFLTTGLSFLKRRKESRIRATGVEAEAVLVQIIDTGSTSNHKPICRLILDVKPIGEAPFRAEVKMALSPVFLSKYPEGSTLLVKFDPQDRSEVVVLP
jgi:hypothetical protein